MHRVFLVPEILNIIFERLPDDGKNNTLASAARTCKLFEEPALENLWHTQSSLVPLLRCAPGAFVQNFEKDTLKDMKNKAKINMKPTEFVQLLGKLNTFYADRPLYPSERNRIQKYAMKIKSFVEKNEETSTAVHIDGSVFSVLFSIEDDYLFNNLRSLKWPISGLQKADYSLLARFLSPKLSHVDLSYFQRHNLDMAVIDMLRKQCHMLSHFTINCNHNAAVSLALRDLFTVSTMLRRVECDVELDAGHLLPLSCIPNLEYLDISIRSGITLKKDTLSSVHSIFPCLKSLTIHSDAVALLTNFLNLGHFSQLSSITSTHSMLPQIGDFQELFQAIARHCSPLVLESITLKITRFRFTPYSNPLDRQDIEPLLDFHNIHTLRIEGMLCYNITDTDVGDMAVAWPKLRNLYFDPNGLWPALSGLTLDSLPKLANHCPELTLFGAKLRVNAHNPRKHSGPSANGKRGYNLQNLHVGPAMINNAGYVAAFLSDIFPEMQECGVHAWTELDEEDLDGAIHSERWDNVNKLYLLLNGVRRQERDLITKSERFSDVEDSEDDAA
ncbi:hypothetical protein ABKN59_009730 [Abortiporus biennis]